MAKADSRITTEVDLTAQDETCSLALPSRKIAA